jgi:hypothetical protein
MKLHYFNPLTSATVIGLRSLSNQQINVNTFLRDCLFLELPVVLVHCYLTQILGIVRK